MIEHDVGEDYLEALKRGWQIHDSVLMANKSFNCRIKFGEQRLSCKPEKEKTYDRVNSNLLLHMLVRCGPSEKVILE